MRRRGEEVALLRVAARVRDDQVLEAVVGVARPRNEVVHVRRLAGPAREALRAVEAPSRLEVDDRPAHALERHALGAEEEALELVLVEALQRRDLDRPLVVDQRAEEVVQPDERLAHAGSQVDAIVEGAALAALVAPDVRLPDGLRPVDRIEERDGLVADGLQAGQGHLDELPLDEVEQALVPGGRSRESFGERGRAVGSSRSPEPLDRCDDLCLPAAGPAALPERAGCPRASVRPVELDDLHGELPCGEEVRRGAVTGRVLEAEVEEGEKDGVLVGGGEAALVEELEDALGEGEGGVRVGVEEQRGNPWRWGRGGVKGSRGRCEVRWARRLERRCGRGRCHVAIESPVPAPWIASDDPTARSRPLRADRDERARGGTWGDRQASHSCRTPGAGSRGRPSSARSPRL